MSEWMTGFLTGFGVLHVLMMIVLGTLLIIDKDFRLPRTGRVKKLAQAILVLVFWEIAFILAACTNDKPRR